MRFKSLIIILLAITVCLSNIEAQASDRLQSLIDAANESIRNNQLDRAKQQLKQAIHIKFNAAEPHYLQGKIAEQSGNLRKAAREYKSAINFDSKHLLAAISWGRVANKLNDFDAVAAYKHAIDIDPDNPLWKLKLSQFYMSQKSVNIRMRAQRQLKNILALKPNHRQALQLLVELEREILAC